MALDSQSAQVYNHTDYIAERGRVMRGKSRDIGAPKPPKDAERKERASGDFAFFCKSYFPFIFELPWSPDHLQAIGKIEAAVLRGQLFAFAMPRGSGKTTLCEIACLWALLYGHHQFVVFVGASEENAKNSLETLKAELETNDVLHEDFQEVTHPVRMLEGSIRRADLQHIEGRLTKIGWRTDEMRLPDVEGSAASGGLVKVRGIDGAIRGLKARMPDGRTARPSLVIVDDCQTDKSAKSNSQCASRKHVLNGAILNLAGPRVKIAGIFPCTVIRKGDAADTILDRKQNPVWHGERFKLVYEWPSNDDLWAKYVDLRQSDLEMGGDGANATEFYKENREAMDAGGRVAWPERFNDDEVSAIQHAYNLRSRDEYAFFAEYQNEPIVEETEERALNPQVTARLVNGLAQREIPQPCTELTAFIDVQKNLLYWAVMAFEPNFTGYVIDYGTWPDQKQHYFTLRGARHTISRFLGAGTAFEANLFQALLRLRTQWEKQGYMRDDGGLFPFSNVLIDANWGESTDTVYDFCRHEARDWFPAHGKFYGAAGVQINEYKRKSGESVGDHWRIPPVHGKRMMRHVLYDTNHWKTFLANRLSTPFPAPGSCTLWRADPSRHKLIADHLHAEYPTLVEAKGRAVTEWKIRPEKPDNHWLDCLAGCYVGASMAGVTLANRPTRKRKRVEYL